MTDIIIIDNMRLFKRGKYWYIELERNKRKSLRTTDRKIAEKLFRKIQIEALQGRLILLEKYEKILLKDFIEEYLSWSKEVKSEATWKKEKWIFKRFFDIIGNKPLRLISVKDCENYLLSQKQFGRNEEGINIDYRHLKAFFNKAKEWNYIKENPWAKVKPLKTIKKPPKFMSPEEIAIVLSYLKSKDPLFEKYVRLCLETGCRRNEILYLTYNDLDFKNEQIYIKGKGNKIRILPMTEEIKKLLKSIPLSGKRLFPWHPDTVTHKWIKTMKALGLSYRLHDLRHTTASWLAMKGISLQIIQTLLGHSDIRVTQIYSHLKPEVIKSALQEISNLLCEQNATRRT